MVHNAKKRTSSLYCPINNFYQLVSLRVMSVLESDEFMLAFIDVFFYLAGVYLAERINRVMGDCWRSFASQNYFDPHGVFLSVVWSGPLLIIATIILMNSLFSLCYMIVRWKRAELRHRARLARGSNKPD
ncbi:TRANSMEMBRANE PROTEIN 18 [Salix koriyanagi]|uniref:TRANSMEMBRANE PROTEIN 18 n=1 Tax=Salix koriyanagi TaxID=2511006 RepID=A0A9Q0W7D5_9ROSI|nr:TRANSMEMBRANE PROTEIN 18 [Salix koriyanagi]